MAIEYFGAEDAVALFSNLRAYLETRELKEANKIMVDVSFTNTMRNQIYNIKDYLKGIYPNIPSLTSVYPNGDASLEKGDYAWVYNTAGPKYEKWFYNMSNSKWNSTTISFSYNASEMLNIYLNGNDTLMLNNAYTAIVTKLISNTINFGFTGNVNMPVATYASNTQHLKTTGVTLNMPNMAMPVKRWNGTSHYIDWLNPNLIQTPNRPYVLDMNYYTGVPTQYTTNFFVYGNIAAATRVAKDIIFIDNPVQPPY
jgi:hypothetical protein